MTENEWLTSANIAALLAYIAPKASDRKQRLYLCGGCRQISHLFFDSASHDAIEIGERYADGLATEEERQHAAYCAECPTFGLALDMRWRAVSTRESIADDSIFPDQQCYIPSDVRKLVEMGALPQEVLHGGEGYVDERVADRLRTAAVRAEATVRGQPFFDEWFFLQTEIVDWPGADLVRCIFGNPFRTAPANPAWLTATVTNLASVIYTDRAFDRLPILADALEEAGCRDADVLEHCRKPGVHARGCWVVDRILDRE